MFPCIIDHLKFKIFQFYGIHQYVWLFVFHVALSLQAYTVELESLVTQLEEENARLLREEVWFFMIEN